MKFLFISDNQWIATEKLQSVMIKITKYFIIRCCLSVWRCCFIRLACGQSFCVATPACGHPLQASLLFLFARHSKSKLFLCTRSSVKSKRRGMVRSPALSLGQSQRFACIRPKGNPVLPRGGRIVSRVEVVFSCEKWLCGFYNLNAIS